MPKQAIMPALIRDVAERHNMSPAVISGRHVFFTGVTGADGNGVMPKAAEAQFEAIWAKISLVLGEVGLGHDAIVEMTTYHVGLRAHFEAFDAVRLSHFSAPYPAWTAVEVAELRREGAIVDVRVIAALRDNGNQGFWAGGGVGNYAAAPALSRASKGFAQSRLGPGSSPRTQCIRRLLISWPNQRLPSPKTIASTSLPLGLFKALCAQTFTAQPIIRKANR